MDVVGPQRVGEIAGVHTDYLRGTAPTHTHGAVKACIVIAGPTLVALIPMAAAPALPAMAQAFKDSGNGALFAQLVVTAPAIMVILGAPLAGILTEWIGRRACILGSLLLFCIFGAGCMLSTSPAGLIAARLALGLSGGALLTNTLALASDFPEGGPRERLLGSMVACTALFSILALNFGGYLVDTFGWRSAFGLYLFGVPVFLVALAGLESHPPLRATHHGLIEPLRAYWAVYLLVVILAVGMFMTPVQGMLLVAANGVARAASQVLFISVYSLSAGVSAASFGWLAPRLGAPRLFVLIAIVFGAGGITAALSGSASGVIAGFAVMGIGAGLIEATAAMLILATAPETLRARAVGLLLSAVFLGQFLNPLVVDPLRTVFGIHGAFLAVSGAFVLLSLALLPRAVGTRLSRKPEFLSS
jgi:MFS family permease